MAIRFRSFLRSPGTFVLLFILGGLLIYAVSCLAGCTPVGPQFTMPGGKSINSNFPNASFAGANGQDIMNTPGGLMRVEDNKGTLVSGGLTPTKATFNWPEMGIESDIFSAKDWRIDKITKTTAPDGAVTVSIEGFGTSASEATKASNGALEALAPIMLQTVLSQQQDNANSRKAMLDMTEKLTKAIEALKPAPVP